MDRTWCSLGPRRARAHLEDGRMRRRRTSTRSARRHDRDRYNLDRGSGRRRLLCSSQRTELVFLVADVRPLRDPAHCAHLVPRGDPLSTSRARGPGHGREPVFFRARFFWAALSGPSGVPSGRGVVWTHSAWRVLTVSTLSPRSGDRLGAAASRSPQCLYRGTSAACFGLWGADLTTDRYEGTL